MDRKSREQTELLRNIWSEIKSVHQSLGKRIDATNARVDALASELKEVKADVKELKTDVNELKTDVNELKTDVNELKTDVKELKTDVKELKTDVAALRDRTDDIQTELTVVRNATSDGFALLVRRDAKHDAELDEIRSRLDRVEKHVGLR